MHLTKKRIRIFKDKNQKKHLTQDESRTPEAASRKPEATTCNADQKPLSDRIIIAQGVFCFPESTRKEGNETDAATKEALHKVRQEVYSTTKVDPTKTIEVYEHDIYIWLDEYLNTELECSPEDFDNRLKYNDYVKKYAPRMFIYIARRLGKLDNGNIKLLDSIFDIYINICVRFNIKPTVEMFCMMCNINISTVYDWERGDYRNASNAHSRTVQKWRNTCKGFLVDDLSNAPGASPNQMFIGKAVYGLVETSPIQTLNTVQAIDMLSLSQIQERHRAAITAGKPDEWQD